MNVCVYKMYVCGMYIYVYINAQSYVYIFILQTNETRHTHIKKQTFILELINHD